MKREFKLEKIVAATDIVDYLQSLTEAFRTGILTLETSQGAFCLQPHGMINMEVEAEDKKDKEKFSIKFSWRKESAIQESLNKEFAITTNEPEEEVVDEATEESVEEVVVECECECTEDPSCCEPGQEPGDGCCCCDCTSENTEPQPETEPVDQPEVVVEEIIEPESTPKRSRRNQPAGE